MNQIQELAELRAIVADLAQQIARMSNEIVTRRIVVLDETGAPRIVGEVVGPDATLFVQTDSEHRAALVASTASCCPLVSVNLMVGDEFPVDLYNACKHTLRAVS